MESHSLLGIVLSYTVDLNMNIVSNTAIKLAKYNNNTIIMRIILTACTGLHESHGLSWSPLVSVQQSSAETSDDSWRPVETH